MDSIPIVDFLPISLVREDVSYQSDAVKAVADNIREAFTTIGFVYLKNFGISSEEVSQIQEVLNSFFELPEDTKKLYQRTPDKTFGWLPFLEESLNPDKPGDLKETFSVKPVCRDEWWPEAHIPGMRRNVGAIWGKCQSLAQRILRLMTLVLGITDLEFFVKCHHVNLGQDIQNESAMRFLHYPSITGEVEEGQLRCGEHTDWGTLTLLFQDQTGGLQVLNNEGEWLEATPMEGTVLVNIGDMLQRWTSGLFSSTTHRVSTSVKASRRSLAFFVDPDNDFCVKPLKGDAYAQVTFGQYIQQKFNKTLHQATCNGLLDDKMELEKVSNMPTHV